MEKCRRQLPGSIGRFWCHDQHSTFDPMRNKFIARWGSLGLLLGAFLGVSLDAGAQTVTNDFTYSPNLVVEDGNPLGVADAHTVTTPIQSLTGIQVNLNISGFGGPGFNGDLYAYLAFTNFVDQTSGFSVLLNRVGRTSGNDLGYGDNGFNVTFDDAAVNGDIHVYRDVINPAGGTLTGIWQPDARAVLPGNALDTTPRTAHLSSFTAGNLNPNGEWTLFLVDNESVNEFVVNSWGMRLIGVVPEPGTYALMSMGVAVALGLRLRRRL